MVAERIIRIPQADLAKVRVTCKNKTCGKVAELTIEQAAASYIGGQCPFCNEDIVPAVAGGSQNPFAHLRTAWDAFAAHADKVAVEFAITDQQ